MLLFTAGCEPYGGGSGGGRGRGRERGGRVKDGWDDRKFATLVGRCQRSMIERVLSCDGQLHGEPSARCCRNEGR